MLFNFNEKLESWLFILNNNAKWAVSIIIRFLLITSFLILFFYCLKWLGILSGLKNLGSSDIPIVTHKEIAHISKPEAPSHTTDIQEITDVQNLISNRIKAMKK
jgi:hypothetical protein